MTGDQAFDYVYPRPSGARKAAVEAFAETIAKDAGFEPGGDIFGFVAQMGGKILVGSSGYGDNESGSLIAKSFSDFTIYVSSLTSIERDRFTIAHELGHLFLHLPVVVTDDPDFLMRATRNIDESSDDQRRAEWEANWFAAAFLMPETAFRCAYQVSANHAKAIFKVSLPAIEARAKSLKIRD